MKLALMCGCFQAQALPMSFDLALLRRICPLNILSLQAGLHSGNMTIATESQGLLPQSSGRCPLHSHATVKDRAGSATFLWHP